MKRLGEHYAAALAEHQQILRKAAEARGGREIDNQGEAFFFAFASANSALGAAVLAQRALAAHEWANGNEVRVRMGLHTGEPAVGGERYVGLGVHRAARIGAVGHGGQVLLSTATRELADVEVTGVSFRDLGSYRLKDIDRFERLYQLDIEGLASDFPPLNAERVAEPRPLSRAEIQVGTEFLGYRIEEVIGRGGMGVVYRAYDLRLKRAVALKLVAAEQALEESFHARFARETELAMSLEHPNVVPIHDAGEVDGRFYLAMRLIEGTNLGALLLEAGPLDPARALSICRQVASALDASHAKGLVHRDVKPSNILLDQKEHAYLTDFGLTRRLEDQGAQASEGRSVATPAYLAPEQVEDGPVDGRADVYSLGCVLYECLAGTTPFSDVAELPEAVDEVIRKALAKEPKDRYSTCAALISAAEEALELRRPRSLGRRRLLGVLVVLVALMAVVLAALLSRGGGGTTVTPESLVKIDVATNEIVDVIPVGRSPREVEVVGDYVFAASEADGTLTRVDLHTGAVTNSGQFDASDGLAAEGDERLWVASVGRHQVTAVDAELPVVDVTERVQSERVPLRGDIGGTSLAVGGGSLWIAITGSSSVVERWRLHPLSREHRYPLELSDFGRGIAFGYGAAWIALGSETNDVLRIDAQSGVATRIPVGNYPGGPAVGFGSIWAVMFDDDTVWRMDPVTGKAQRIVLVGDGPWSVAVGSGSLWVTNECDGTVSRVDPDTNTVVETIETGYQPRWLAVGGGFVWVGVTEVKDLDEECP